MCELIVKLVYDEMNIRRCIKKSIAVQIEKQTDRQVERTSGLADRQVDTYRQV